jgi:ribosomal protein L15
VSDGIFDGAFFASANAYMKLLGEGDVPAGLKTVRNVLLSASAREKLAAKGVTIEE